MIPAFDIHGVVPPIRPGQAGHSPDRAPYSTDMLAFCKRFGNTPERRAILRGLLDLRDALRGAGILEGFQWLDGSFAEDVERLRGRSPADIDVVTFGAFGSAEVQRERAKTSPELFVRRGIKAAFKVDHYLVRTDDPSDADGSRLSQKIAYWYSMWAHQRDTERWKGFVTVPLQSSDGQARSWLDQHADGAAP